MTDVPAPHSAHRGAACAIHPEARAVFACSRCGNFGCEGCLFSATAEHEVCFACAQRGLGEGVPWERGRQIGWVRAWWHTTRRAMFSPTRFFRTPPVVSGPMAPIAYGVVSHTIGMIGYALFIAFWLVLSAVLIERGMPESDPDAVFATFGCASVGAFFTLVVIAPFQALFGIVFAAGLAHGTLAMVRSAHAGFEQTLRVVSYANAPYVWMVVPCIGPLVSMAWVPLVEVIGLREAHGISTGRAALAAIGWRTVLGLLFIGLYVGLFLLGTQMGAASP